MSLHFEQIDVSTTKNDYLEACSILTELALSHSGTSGRIAAQLMLSAYNSFSFHFPIADLCALDSDLVNKSIHVIRGRAFYEEPHMIIENGDRKFTKLWDMWEHLRVNK